MMNYPEAYLEYLVEFHGTRDYFECHEIMEEHWKVDAKDPFTNTWLGLIQAAVSSYHHRRGNRIGAMKMMQATIEHSNSDHLTQLGIHADQWLEMLQNRYQALQQNDMRFDDLNVPLQDEALIQQCKLICQEKGLVWGAPSDMSRPELIHRHKLRDRSEVIAERARQLAARQIEREQDII